VKGAPQRPAATQGDRYERRAIPGGGAGGEIQQPPDVADGAGGDRDLHHVGPALAHRGVEAVEVLRRALEVVVRHDEAAAGLLDHDVGERTPVLDVHVIEAALDRFQQRQPPPWVVVRQAPAFRGGAAGQEDRLGPPAQDREQVQVQDHVRAHLEEVGDAGQLLHALDDPRRRLVDEGDADLGHGLDFRRPEMKKPLQGSLKRLTAGPISPGNPLRLAAGPPGPPLGVVVAVKDRTPATHGDRPTARPRDLGA
jgi:hypothetical protein